jgi:hypothetical protein
MGLLLTHIKEKELEDRLQDLEDITSHLLMRELTKHLFEGGSDLPFHVRRAVDYFAKHNFDLTYLLRIKKRTGV